MVRLQGDLINSTPQNESWVFALLLGLFLFFIISLHRSTGWITETLKNFFVKRSRSGTFFRSASHNLQSRLMLSLFSTAVIVLFVYTSIFQEGNFEFSRYLQMLATGILYLVLKYYLISIIGYTFLNDEFTILSKEAYFTIYSLLGVLLFPILVINIYLPLGENNNFPDIIALLFTGLALITVILKVFQFFYHKLLDIFYIMLYLCTLEILPLIGMFQAYKFIVIGYVY